MQLIEVGKKTNGSLFFRRLIFLCWRVHFVTSVDTSTTVAAQFYIFVLAFQFSFVSSVIKRRTRRFHHIRVISTFRSFRRALYTRGDVYVHGETTSVLDPGKNDRETVIRYQLPRRSADRHGVNLFWGKSGLLKHSSVHGLKFQEEVQRQFNNLPLCAMAKKRSG